MTEGKRPEAVFVVGCARSGTSLLRALIDQDTGLAFASETHFLDHWLPKYSRIADPHARVAALWCDYRTSRHFTRLGLTPEHVDELSAADSPRDLFTRLIQLFAAERGATTPGEKTPSHFRYLDTLLRWFPDAHVLFAIRDPRAVVASLQALDVDWAQRGFSHHVQQWLAAAAMARRWGADSRVTIVRYEDLVADPQGVTNGIFLTLLDRPSLPELIEQRQHRSESRLDNGSLLSDSSISQDRIDAWRARLSHDQIAAVERRCTQHMTSFGYEAESRTVRARFRIQQNAEWLAHLGGRGLRAGRDPLGAAARLRYRHGRQR